MKRLWIALVRFFGWQLELPARGERPELRRCVFAVAPHTSAWDFVVGAAYLWSLDTDGHVLIKKEFFRWPLGPILRHLGAIPVDRGNRHNGLVAAATAAFAGESGKAFSLAITPEGTRRATRRWHRGFWEIARGAGVPIVPAYLDYQHKRIWLGEALWPTDDYEADLQQVQSGYRASMARHPEKFVELFKEGVKGSEKE